MSSKVWRMKIFYISTALFPSKAANTSQVMQMCQAFSRLGHSVTLHCPNRVPGNCVTSEDEIRAFYGIVSGFRIDFADIVSSKHSSIAFCFRAVRRARRIGCDLVFTRNVHAAAWCALFHIPVILEYHALQGNFSERAWLKLANLNSAGAGIVFISEGLKRDFLSIYPALFARNRVRVCHDGVDLKRFDEKTTRDVRKELQISREEKVAGYVGHFYPGRGVYEIILPLAHSLSDVRFLIVGGNENDFDQLKMRTFALPNVSLVPFVPSNEVPHYLAACDLLLAPYQRKISGSSGGETSRWASPLKLFEYMASQRPIIISDLEVLREVLDDDNCFFCSPDDLEHWENTVRTVFCREEEGMKRAFRAHQVARSYCWEDRASRCLDLLSS